MQPGSTAQAGWRRPLAHADGWSGLLGIALLNALLNLLTFFVYRFWGRTAVRRWLWRRTTLLGEPLEYTGTGWELCLGFLKVLLIVFLPLALYNVAVDLLLSPFAAWAPMAANLPVYLLFLYLLGQAVWRARRYRLGRTLWRGMRFGQDGSPHGYATAQFGRVLLAMLTLGLTYPAMQMALACRLWSGTRIGDRGFRIDGAPRAPYAAFMLAWATALFALGALAAAAAALEQALPLATEAALSIVLAAPLLLPLAALFYARYRARFLETLALHLALDGLRFRFTGTTAGVLWLYAGNLLLVLASFGVLAPLAERRKFAFVCRHVEMLGEPDIDAMLQGALVRSRSGEGLADALDVGL